MWMTEDDIVRSYNNAVDQTAQVRILAELNGCAKKTIITILERKGALTAEPRKTNRGNKRGIIQDKQVRDMLEAGIGYKEVAEKLGIPYGSVQYYRQRAESEL